MGSLMCKSPVLSGNHPSNYPDVIVSIPTQSQVHFLIDEAASTGKGANQVISFLHYYLENFGLKELFTLLFADNCAG